MIRICVKVEELEKKMNLLGNNCLRWFHLKKYHYFKSHACVLFCGAISSAYCSFFLILMVSQTFCALQTLDTFIGTIIYTICSSSVHRWSCSFQCIILCAFFRTAYVFLFFVPEASQTGIDEYSTISVSNTFINIVFIFGVKLLNLLIVIRWHFLFFIVLLMWPTNPVVKMFNPSSFPDLLVSISFPLA